MFSLTNYVNAHHSYSSSQLSRMLNKKKRNINICFPSKRKKFFKPYNCQRSSFTKSVHFFRAARPRALYAMQLPNRPIDSTRHSTVRLVTTRWRWGTQFFFQNGFYHCKLTLWPATEEEVTHEGELFESEHTPSCQHQF